jgi:L-ascorbate metabolism protein UlaG (beta-lactamase superfamily)
MASGESVTITHIGGPTALVEFGGVRLVTDPTFDPAGTQYASGPVTLRKLSGPALGEAEIGPIDYVLLSHDHHYDNLDHAGRDSLSRAKGVLTTGEGAARMGGNSIAFEPWQSVDFPAPGGRVLRVIGTPARHGPPGLDNGPVTGFILFFAGSPERAVYFSGDTVWYEGVAEVAARFPVRVALLNLGAARVPEVGPFHLTMTADEAVETARIFPGAAIVPLHYEGWAHFSEGREQIDGAFLAAGLEERLRWPEPGRPVSLAL